MLPSTDDDHRISGKEDAAFRRWWNKTVRTGCWRERLAQDVEASGVRIPLSSGWMERVSNVSEEDDWRQLKCVIRRAPRRRHIRATVWFCVQLARTVCPISSLICVFPLSLWNYPDESWVFIVIELICWRIRVTKPKCATHSNCFDTIESSRTREAGFFDLRHDREVSHHRTIMIGMSLTTLVDSDLVINSFKRNAVLHCVVHWPFRRNSLFSGQYSFVFVFEGSAKVLEKKFFSDVWRSMWFRITEEQLGDLQCCYTNRSMKKNRVLSESLLYCLLNFLFVFVLISWLLIFTVSRKVQ